MKIEFDKNFHFWEYKDYLFNKKILSNSMHYIFKFDNGYGAFIFNEYYPFGEKYLWTLYPIKFIDDDWSLLNSNDDIYSVIIRRSNERSIGHLNTLKVLALLDKIKSFKKEEITKERKGMTGNEYQQLAARTINKDNTPIGLERHAIYGMCSEIGELQALYQKVYQGHKFDIEHAKKEVGDLLWFIAEYCTVMEWNLEDVMEANIEKLKNRYPEGFEDTRSINRPDWDI